MRKRIPENYPPKSVEESLDLVKNAMRRVGLVGSRFTPEQIRQAVLETGLAAELEEITKCAGLPKQPQIPKEWGWPTSWVESLFYKDDVVRGICLYSPSDKMWRILAVQNGGFMVDSRNGRYVSFDSIDDAKGNIDAYNENQKRVTAYRRVK